MRRRTVVEECFILSLHRVVRDHRRGRLSPFVLGVALQPEHANVRLAVQAATQDISLVHAPHNLRGIRWWLLCECGRRVFTLYRPIAEPEYRCRACHALSYRGENLSPAGRLEHRAMKLARRLGGSLLQSPSRPKGMHATTFARQSARANAANARALTTRLAAWQCRLLRIATGSYAGSNSFRAERYTDRLPAIAPHRAALVSRDDERR